VKYILKVNRKVQARLRNMFKIYRKIVPQKIMTCFNIDIT